MQCRFMAAATTAGSLDIRQCSVASALCPSLPIDIATVEVSNQQNSIICRALLVSCSLPLIRCKFLVLVLVSSCSIVKPQVKELEQTGEQPGVPQQKTERLQQ